MWNLIHWFKFEGYVLVLLGVREHLRIATMGVDSVILRKEMTDFSTVSLLYSIVLRNLTPLTFIAMRKLYCYGGYNSTTLRTIKDVYENRRR